MRFTPEFIDQTLLEQFWNLRSVAHKPIELETLEQSWEETMLRKSDLPEALYRLEKAKLLIIDDTGPKTVLQLTHDGHLRIAGMRGPLGGGVGREAALMRCYRFQQTLRGGSQSSAHRRRTDEEAANDEQVTHVGASNKKLR